MATGGIRDYGDDHQLVSQFEQLSVRSSGWYCADVSLPHTYSLSDY